MQRSPCPNSPTKKACDPSKAKAQVAFARIPCLCSRPIRLTPFRSPSWPSINRWRDTTNRLMPLVPAGASGVRASTR